MDDLYTRRCCTFKHQFKRISDYKFWRKGVGQATLITQLFMLLVYSIYCVRIFNLSFSIHYFIRLIAFAALCIFAIYILGKYRFTANQLYDMMLHLTCYFSLIPFFAFVSGLIDKQTFQLKVGISK